MVAFAIVMEKPLSEPPKDLNFLRKQFRFILQRVNALAELKSDDGLAAVMFNGNGSQFSNLAERFSNWIFRSESGRALDRLAESPFFVDSKFTPEFRSQIWSRALSEYITSGGLMKASPMAMNSCPR